MRPQPGRVPRRGRGEQALRQDGPLLDAVGPAARQLPGPQRRHQRGRVPAALGGDERLPAGRLGPRDVLEVHVGLGEEGEQPGPARSPDGSGERLLAQGAHGAVEALLVGAAQGEHRVGDQPGPVRSVGHGDRLTGRRQRPGRIRGAEPGRGQAGQEAVARPGVDRGVADVEGEPVEPDALLERERAHGGGGRPLDPRRRLGPLACHGRGRPVPGEVREVGIDPVAGVAQDRVDGGPVQPDPLAAGEAGLDGVPDEGVDEPVPAGCVGRLEQAGGRRLVDRVQALQQGPADDGGEDDEVDGRAEHRRDAQLVAAPRGESAQPPPDGLAHPGRDADRAALGEVAAQLGDEEGIAGTELVHPLGLLGGHRGPDDARQLRRDGLRREPAEREALDRRPAGQGRRSGGVVVRGDEQQPAAAQLRGHVVQEPQGRGIGPVDVVEHDEEPGGLCRRVQHPEDRVEQPEPVLLDGRRAVGQRGEIGPVDRSSGTGEPMQDLAPRQERRRGVGSGAGTPRDRDAVRRGTPRELRDEPGPADTELAATEHEPGVAGERGREHAGQRGQLAVATHQPGRHRSRTPSAPAARPGAVSSGGPARASVRPARALRTGLGEHRDTQRRPQQVPGTEGSQRRGGARARVPGQYGHREGCSPGASAEVLPPY
ncbi:hypothetical protein GCM10023215_49090 [Pseudonocardia yuanmonensis]|uniref:Uncharacterized protein n=1 Tax=Pseudonocardia yuanmonensis TaxID=1095914 RepID=A0ABP8X9M4_9PSEU